MKTIEVKDSQWYRDLYNMPQKIKVYVGETKAQHDQRIKQEYDLYVYNRDMGYSGFDEHPETEDVEEADLA